MTSRLLGSMRSLHRLAEVFSEALPMPANPRPFQRNSVFRTEIGMFDQCLAHLGSIGDDAQHAKRSNIGRPVTNMPNMGQTCGPIAVRKCPWNLFWAVVLAISAPAATRRRLPGPMCLPVSARPEPLLFFAPRDPRGPRLCAAACDISDFIIKTVGIERASGTPNS